MSKRIKQCVRCGAEFKTRSATQRFCSYECKSQSQRQPRDTLVCAHCGKTFEARVKANRLYCSSVCAAAANRATGRYIKCKQCGKEFRVKRESTRKFCSKKCSGLDRRVERARDCDWCGKEFSAKDSRRFCSKVCRYASISDTLRDAHPILPCAHCRKEFQTTPNRHRFCCLECYRASIATPRGIKVCEGCGEEFDPGRWHKRKFCGMPCYLTNMRKHRREHPDVVRRSLTCQSPNERELDLWLLLDDLGLQYNFVGNGAMILDGKCPDFVNTNGHKKIIELFGENWHEPEEEQPRKEAFRAFGYETLIVWSKELNSPETLAEKLLAFEAAATT